MAGEISALAGITEAFQLWDKQWGSRKTTSGTQGDQVTKI